MAENSKIQWTDHTFNPWRGCTKVSAGCSNCYAETMSGRNPKVLGVWGPTGTRVVASEVMWREPVKWNKAAACTCNASLGRSNMRAFEKCPQHRPGGRPRVFCASLADVFEDWTGPMIDSHGPETSTGTGATVRLIHNEFGTDAPWVPSTCGHSVTMDHVRVRLFRLIAETPNLDWLLLTKRPQNILSMWNYGHRPEPTPDKTLPFPANVWLGASVENQQTADTRIPELLKIPAAVRFLSMEPLLGPVSIGLAGTLPKADFPGYQMCHERLNWVIVGGESGAGSRRFEIGWARDIVAECKESGVPVFVKQLGEHPTEAGDFGAKTGPVVGLRLIDKKGGDPDEWPEDLRVREFPKPEAR